MKWPLLIALISFSNLIQSQNTSFPFLDENLLQSSVCYQNAALMLEEEEVFMSIGPKAGLLKTVTHKMKDDKLGEYENSYKCILKTDGEGKDGLVTDILIKVGSNLSIAISVDPFTTGHNLDSVEIAVMYKRNSEIHCYAYKRLAPHFETFENGKFEMIELTDEGNVLITQMLYVNALKMPELLSGFLLIPRYSFD